VYVYVSQARLLHLTGKTTASVSVPGAGTIVPAPGTDTDAVCVSGTRRRARAKVKGGHERQGKVWLRVPAM